jgi:hypothetical protein
MRDSPCCRSISRTARSFARRSRSCGRRSRAARRSDESRDESRGYLRLAAKYAAAANRRSSSPTGFPVAARRRFRRRCSSASARFASAATSSASGCTASVRSSGSSRCPQGLYAPAEIEATYDRLRDLARDIVDADAIAIVDATFLDASSGEQFHALAAELGVPFVILAFEASEATLRRGSSSAMPAAPMRRTPASPCSRIRSRRANRSSPDERACTVVYDAEAPLDVARAPAAWNALTSRLQV